MPLLFIHVFAVSIFVLDYHKVKNVRSLEEKCLLCMQFGAFFSSHFVLFPNISLSGLLMFALW